MTKDEKNYKKQTELFIKDNGIYIESLEIEKRYMEDDLILSKKSIALLAKRIKLAKEAQENQEKELEALK